MHGKVRGQLKGREYPHTYEKADLKKCQICDSFCLDIYIYSPMHYFFRNPLRIYDTICTRAKIV